MATLIKTISLTSEEVEFCDLNNISLTQLMKESIHTIMNTQNSMIVQNLRKKCDILQRLVLEKDDKLRKLEEQIDDTLKGGFLSNGH